MLMFIFWCLAAVAYCDGVVADSEHLEPCESGDELHRKIESISSSLKVKTPFTNQNWTKNFQTLHDSKFMTPPELSKELVDLNDVATQYDNLLSQFYANATNIVADFTYNYIFSDQDMMKYIDCDSSYFNGTLLVTACALVDEVQKISSNYTLQIGESFNRLQMTLLPHNNQIIENLNELTTNLTSGANIDFDGAASDAAELTQLIRTDSAHLLQNTYAEFFKFEIVVDELACDAETMMKVSAKALYYLLPVECHLSMEPECDTPTHLLKRVMGMVKDLNNVQLIVDSVPSQVAHQLKSSTLWKSEHLQDSLDKLMITTERFNDLIDDVAGKIQIQIKKVTDENVMSDFDLVKVIEDNKSGVLQDSSYLLLIACDYGDAGRNLTAEYKWNILRLVKNMLVPEKWNEILEIWGKELSASGGKEKSDLNGSEENHEEIANDVTGGSEEKEKVNEREAEGVRKDKLNRNNAEVNREAKTEEIIDAAARNESEAESVQGEELSQNGAGGKREEKVNEIVGGIEGKDRLNEPEPFTIRAEKSNQNVTANEHEEKINEPMIVGNENGEKVNDTRTEGVHEEKSDRNGVENEPEKEKSGSGSGIQDKEELQKITNDMQVVIDHMLATMEYQFEAFEAQLVVLARKVNADIVLITDKMKEMINSHTDTTYMDEMPMINDIVI